jgi:hypothetical protein
MTSSLKKMCNEVSLMEKKSTTIISPNNYYIVKLEMVVNNDYVHDVQSINLQTIGVEHCLFSTPRPTIMYHSANVILLLFSCVASDDSPSENSHQCNGDYAAIISKYVLFFSENAAFSPEAKLLRITADFTVKIVQFETQSEIISYLSCIIFQESKNAMIKISNGKITAKDINFKTNAELMSQLEEQGIKWDAIDAHKKFGTISKISENIKGRRSEKTSGKVDANIFSISELIDFREHKKYNKFIFGT